MKRVRFLAAARAEVRAAALWYEARGTGLGLEFIAAIDEAVEKIAARAGASPLWRTDRPYRKQVVERFPYIVFFEVADDFVTVVAVAHQRRQPGYWLGR